MQKPNYQLMLMEVHIHDKIITKTHYHKLYLTANVKSILQQFETHGLGRGWIELFVGVFQQSDSFLSDRVFVLTIGNLYP